MQIKDQPTHSPSLEYSRLMGQRVVLIGLAMAMVVGVLGCGGVGRHTTLTSTARSKCKNCGLSDHTAYRAVAVRAAFKHGGLRLKHFGYLTLNSVPHVQLLGYSVTPHVTASGTPIGGLYFEVFVFRNVAASTRAITNPYVAGLKVGRRPWRRLSNVLLVASAPVILPANHNRTVWRKAVTALDSLAR